MGHELASRDWLEDAVDYLLDPITGSPSKGKCVDGALIVHVDDLLMTGSLVFNKQIVVKIGQLFQIGTVDVDDCRFTGQRVLKQGRKVVVHQDLAVDELHEVALTTGAKDETEPDKPTHTAFCS